MLHYKACARTRTQKAGDIALMFFGMLAAVYTSVQTIKVRLSTSLSHVITDNPYLVQLMAEPSAPSDPIGDCRPRDPGAGTGPDSPLWSVLGMFF